MKHTHRHKTQDKNTRKHERQARWRCKIDQSWISSLPQLPMLGKRRSPRQHLKQGHWATFVKRLYTGLRNLGVKEHCVDSILVIFRFLQRASFCLLDSKPWQLQFRLLKLLLPCLRPSWKLLKRRPKRVCSTFIFKLPTWCFSVALVVLMWVHVDKHFFHYFIARQRFCIEAKESSPKERRHDSDVCHLWSWSYCLSPFWCWPAIITISIMGLYASFWIDLGAMLAIYISSTIPASDLGMKSFAFGALFPVWIHPSHTCQRFLMTD